MIFLPTPCRPDYLLARSQSSTFHVSLARGVPSCFRLSALPFLWNIHPLCKGGQGPFFWACPYYSRGTLIVMCIKDLLRCLTCPDACHKHLAIFITFIHGLVFFTILSVLGHLLHFVPSTVGAKFKYFKLLLLCAN